MTSSPKDSMGPVEHVSPHSRSKSIAEASSYQPYFDQEEAVAMSVDVRNSCFNGHSALETPAPRADRLTISYGAE